jgi:hypothetical protein
MILNSAYGKDSMNSELFAKIVFRNKQGTLHDQAYPTFKAARQINENYFAVEKECYHYTISSAMQEVHFR